MTRLIPARETHSSSLKMHAQVCLSLRARRTPADWTGRGSAFHINQQNNSFLLMHTSLQTNTILQHHKTHLWIIQHWNRHHRLSYPKKSSWLACLLQVYWAAEHPVPCCGCTMLYFSLRWEQKISRWCCQLAQRPTKRKDQDHLKLSVHLWELRANFSKFKPNICHGGF